MNFTLRYLHFSVNKLVGKRNNFGLILKGVVASCLNGGCFLNRPFSKIPQYSLLSLQNFAKALFSISFVLIVSPKHLKEQNKSFTQKNTTGLTYIIFFRSGRNKRGANIRASFIDDMSFHSTFWLTLKKKTHPLPCNQFLR